MAVEYYVKRKLSNGDFKLISTHETSAQAVREAAKLQKLSPRSLYCAFYSQDAITLYEESRYVAQ